MKRLLHALTAGTLIGAVTLGAAWAGVGLTPPRVADDVPGTDIDTGIGTEAAGATGVPAAPPAAASGAAAVDADALAGHAAAGERLPDGMFLAGAAKVSIAPPADRWKPHNPNGGTNCGSPELYTPNTPDGCLLTFDRRWATSVDPLGVHARAWAVSNGETTVVSVVLDTVGWFAKYPATVCDRCGIDDIAADVERATGGRVKADGIVVSSTHTHANPDTLASTPAWYYNHVRDRIKEAILGATTEMRPAVLETGSIPAKQLNVDRRIATRAIPDYELGWLRARVPARATGTAPGTIFTFVNFSVHPTILTNNALIHSGLVGPMAQQIEDAFGGVAVFAPAGLGDQTVDRSFGPTGIGGGLAKLVIEDAARRPYQVTSNDIVTHRAQVAIPVDNLFMTSAGMAGVFVRDLSRGGGGMGQPAAYNGVRGGSRVPHCTSASPNSVVAPVGGFRIGTPGATKGETGDAVVVLQSPGEAFSSISLVVKDYLSKSRNVLLIGLANDTIGYLIPSQQFDETAEQGVGLLNNSLSLGDYEETLSLGRCAGDQVMEELLRAGEKLGVMGWGEGV